MRTLPRSFGEIGETTILTKSNQKIESNNFKLAKFMDIDTFNKILLQKNVNNFDFFPDVRSEIYLNTNMAAYLSLTRNRNQENQNENKESAKYKIYEQRLKKLLEYANGITLDVGADNCDALIRILPNGVNYVGLSPDRAIQNENKELVLVKGLGEFLPFKNESFDTVMFNTSLDHILDANQAISEAYRVLKSDGILLICSLVWISNFELWRDDVHFHHFRPCEIEGLLENFEIKYLETYKYSYDTHRYGAFLSAKKL
jgi:SAM-dependent methyltransferase